MTFSRVPAQAAFKQKLIEYRDIVSKHKDDLTTHINMLRFLSISDSDFGKENEELINVVQEIQTNALKLKTKDSYSQFNFLMLNSLLILQPSKAVEFYLSIYQNHQHEPIIDEMMLDMLSELLDTDLLKKMYQTVDLSHVSANIHNMIVDQCAEEYSEIVLLVLSNSKNLDVFKHAIKVAIHLEKTSLIKAILELAKTMLENSGSEIIAVENAKDIFYRFAIECAIEIRNSELVDFIYRQAQPASTQVHEAYNNSKSVLPPTQAEVVTRIMQLEKLLDANPTMTSHDLGKKNSQLVLLDEGVFAEIIYRRMRDAGVNKQDKKFLDQQFKLAQLVCPLDQHENLIAALIKAAINCMELEYAWAIYFEYTKASPAFFTTDFSILLNLLDIFIYHDRFDLLNQAYMHALFILQDKEEEMNRLPSRMVEYTFPQYFMTIKEVHHKMIRAMAKSQDTVDKAYIIFKALCEYQRGKYVDWSICTEMIISACHNGSAELGLKTLKLAKSVLEEWDILHVRREVIRRVASNRVLLDKTNQMFVKEEAELMLLKKTTRAAEKSAPVPSYTLSQLITQLLFRSAKKTGEKHTEFLKENDRYSGDKLENGDSSVILETAQTEETRNQFVSQSHFAKKVSPTAYTMWSRSCFSNNEPADHPEELPTSTLLTSRTSIYDGQSTLFDKQKHVALSNTVKTISNTPSLPCKEQIPNKKNHLQTQF